MRLSLEQCASAGLSLLAGDPTAAIVADVRSIDRTNASEPPLPPRVAILESTQAAGGSPSLNTDVDPAFGSSLVYRTAENGDVTLLVSARQLEVHVAHGPRFGLSNPR
jgi:hypothetical protein